jgi:hypothetical protein
MELFWIKVTMSHQHLFLFRSLGMMCLVLGLQMLLDKTSAAHKNPNQKAGATELATQPGLQSSNQMANQDTQQDHQLEDDGEGAEVQGTKGVRRVQIKYVINNTKTSLCLVGVEGHLFKGVYWMNFIFAMA